MKYLLIDFDNEQSWLEIGTEGFALRQIILDSYGVTHVSCLEDCLAEGIINESELDGKIIKITQFEFESYWKVNTLEKRKSWDILKKQYPIDKVVECKVKYFYPQGCILEIGQLQGICNVRFGLYPNDYLDGKVIGYDETNMWLLISEVN